MGWSPRDQRNQISCSRLAPAPHALSLHLPFPSHFHLATSSSSPSSSSLDHPKFHTRHSTYSSTLVLVIGDITPSPPHPAFVAREHRLGTTLRSFYVVRSTKQLELDSGDQTRTTIDNELDYLCQLQYQLDLLNTYSHCHHV